MAFRFKGFNPMLSYWRKMCECPTKAEVALEPAIASTGERYRHQYPFWGLKYFADFALLDSKVIIEVDGDSHNRPEQKEKDLLHEAAVLAQGWVVVRVSNEQALRDPRGAVEAARREAAALDKELQAQVLTAQLHRLHQNYPHLLAEAATHSKSRRQSALKSAKTRRAKKAAGAYPRRKRGAAALGPE